MTSLTHGGGDGLLPPPGAANVTGYSRGINGVMVDIPGLPAGVVLTAEDFEFRSHRGSAGWIEGPAPREVRLRRGAGASGSDRVTLVWDDFTRRGGANAAVADGWLEVTVKANARTGLSAPDVFRFGNLRGDSGGAGAMRVDARDLARTRSAMGRTADAGNPFDHNRDGRVNVLDVAVARANLLRTLASGEWDPTVAAQGTVSLPRRRGAYGVLLRATAIRGGGSARDHRSPGGESRGVPPRFGPEVRARRSTSGNGANGSQMITAPAVRIGPARSGSLPCANERDWYSNPCASEVHWCAGSAMMVCAPSPHTRRA